MPDLGPHSGFIELSYLAAFLACVGLILWVWLDERAQRRRLETLERRGLKRRSVQSVRDGR